MFGSKDTPPVVSGWLNKRKRKKLQGFAKRWVVLDENGLLSYSLGPNHRPRETIRVSLATIARSKRHRDIHVDCGWTLWHFKALNDEDWEKWTVALRRFITVSETEAFSGSATNNRKSRRNKHGGGSRVVEVNSDKPQIDVDDLSDVVNQMASHLKDAQKATEAVAEPDQPGNREKVKAKLNIFGKKGDAESPQAAGLKQLQSSLQSLQREHDRLSDIVAAALGVESGRTGGYSAAAFASRSAMGLKSVGSTMSDETEEGYEDAREFDLDAVGAGGAQSGPELGNASSAPSESEADEGEGADDDDEDDSTDDTSVSSGDTAKESGDGKQAKAGGWLGRKKDKKKQAKDDTADDGGDEGGDDDKPAKDPVKRRTELPHGVAGDETSMFSVLKKNMGKDLSKISMPITFNEPISALQKLAEDFEYSNLLNRAAKTEDPIDRIALIAAWAVSGFSSSKNRGARKPFNPMLGETYELERQDLGLKFMSEKVSHHPPVMAAYVEGKGWTATADSGGRQKFWGRSMEYMPEGTTTIKFKEHDCEYTIDERPSVFVRNIMSGTKYIENQGELKINASTGEKATIKFEQSGWGGGSKNKVTGELKDSNGKSAAKLEGKWDEELSRKGDGDNYQRLWKVTDFPKDTEKYYGFSTYTIQLNEITDDIKDKLPPTDSRKRPDQSAFEQGEVEKAEELKRKLEEGQRARRSEWEKSNKDPQPPQFFKKSGKKWEYNGSYWDKREKGDIPDIDIFKT